MSKLSETTTRIRRYVVFFIIFTIIVILGQTIYQYIKNSNQFSPKVNYYASVNSLFGTIEYPEISTLLINEDSRPQFATNGKFPEYPNSVNVYKVSKPRETLASAVIAEDIALKLGFDFKYQEDGDYLIWSKDKRIFKYNKVTRNSFYLNESALQEIDSNLNYSDIKKSIDRAFSDVLRVINIPSSISQNINTYYLRSEDNGLVEVNSIEIADLIRRDYRQSFEICSIRSVYSQTGDIPSDIKAFTGEVYTDDPFEGIVHVTIPKSSLFGFELQDVKEFAVVSYNVDTTQKGVYKLKPIEVAWEDVKKGNGYLKFLGKSEEKFLPFTSKSVTKFIADVKQSSLEFYMPKEWHGYIYPIYVFRGNAELNDGSIVDFVFYAKAIE